MNNLLEESQANILVVDDMAANLRLLTRLLSDSGYEVRSAPNGNLALKTMEQGKLPDLILLDIMMPGIDGYEVCRRLKDSERTRHIPVIFISALNDTTDKIKAFQLGGVDYLAKPFEPEEVLARVKTHLTLSQMQKCVESQNVHLQQEMAERQRFAEALKTAHDELELHVQRRTQELEEANKKLHQLVTQLEQVRHAAELAYQTKTAFFANVSHELRTPLNIILGSLHILSTSRELTVKQQTTLNTIQHSGEYLLTLINDILDITHIETNQIELHPVEIHLNKFLQDLVTNFAQRAAQKRLAFTYEPLSPLPTGINADEKRLRQILINLLSNAVNFTERGGITFRVKSERLYDRKTASSMPTQLHFEVIDTGIGIADSHLNRIFFTL
jgi:two-component system, sensor histidine kinase and response regulator